jgi:hypothetical protein
MQLIVVKNKKQEDHKKKKKYRLIQNHEPPSPSSNGTSKHDYGSEEGEDDLRNKRLGVFSKDIHIKN